MCVHERDARASLFFSFHFVCSSVPIQSGSIENSSFVYFSIQSRPKAGPLEETESERYFSDKKIKPLAQRLPLAQIVMEILLCRSSA